MKQSRKRMTRVVLSGFGLLAVSSTSGCGRFKRPSTVVHSVYMDCNNGEYPKARHLFVERMRTKSDGALETNGQGIRQVCDRLTNSGTIADIDIREETVRGDHAVVVADVHFDSGATRYGERTSLVREDGTWKITGQ
jgi:hypothetical protein